MGGMMGGVTGGFMGEMKIEESLYLKGSAPSDGRDGALSSTSQQKSEHEIKLFDVHQQEALNFQHAILSITFPYWEQDIPFLGID
ncbi:MAG: hypothetical protein IJS48_02645 [Prevotella sp.]|nr:hypothetical protein [Prevotella sp.]